MFVGISDLAVRTQRMEHAINRVRVASPGFFPVADLAPLADELTAHRWRVTVSVAQF